MKKVTYNIRIYMLIAFYAASILLSYSIGSIIHNRIFAMAMIQLTIATVFLILYFPNLATQWELLKTGFLKGLLYYLLCFSFFIFLLLLSIMNVMELSYLLSIDKADHILLVILELFGLYVCLPLNHMFLFTALNSIKSRQSMQAQALAAFGIALALDIALFLVVAPSSLFVHAIYALFMYGSLLLLQLKKQSGLLFVLAFLSQIIIFLLL